MFQDRNIYSGCFLIVVLVVMLSMGATEILASTLEPGEARGCDHALAIELGRTMRGGNVTSGVDSLFSLKLPAAGILTVEVAAEGTPEVHPRVGILGNDCRPLRVDSAAATIERSVSRQVIVLAEPGSYYLQVAAADPRLALGAFRLTTDFLHTDTVRTVHLVRPPSGRVEVVIERTVFHALHRQKNEPEEVDPDPNKSQRHEPILTLLAAGIASFDKNEPEEVDPDPNKSVQRPEMSASLLLFPARPVNWVHKNEPEEVDPDPNKSAMLFGQLVDGLLTVAVPGRGSGPQQSFVSFQLTDAMAPLEWLAEILEIEGARARLIASGSGDHRLRILEFEG